MKGKNTPATRHHSTEEGKAATTNKRRGQQEPRGGRMPFKTRRARRKAGKRPEATQKQKNKKQRADTVEEGRRTQWEQMSRPLDRAHSAGARDHEASGKATARRRSDGQLEVESDKRFSNDAVQVVSDGVQVVSAAVGLNCTAPRQCTPKRCADYRVHCLFVH
jgi:hypothetical protein